MDKPASLKYYSRIATVAFVVFVIGYFARPFLVPIVFSAFFSLMVLPLCNKLEDHRFSRLSSTITVLVGLVLIFLGFIAIISVQMNDFVKELPVFVDKLKELGDDLLEGIEEVFNVSYYKQIAWIRQYSDTVMQSGNGIFGNALSITSSLITFLALVPIYMLFMLLYREKFKRFLVQLFSRQNKLQTLRIIERIKDIMQSYLSGMAIVIVIIAILNTIGLYLLDIEYALFLGATSSLLMIIPYIGVFTGGLMAVLVALITKDSVWYAVGVVAVYSFIQFLEANFITPNIVGSKVNINPLAAIIGLVGGGYYWGIVGMIIAIPVMAVLKIALKSIPALRPFATLLENHRHGENISSGSGWFKRMFYKLKNAGLW